MTHRLLVGGDLFLYGDVGDAWGDGSGFTAREVVDALAEVGSGPLNVHINSGGGFAFDGVAIYNALRAHDGKVTTYVDGIAASAASVIFMAGEERVAPIGSVVMIHDPSSLTMGDAQTHRKSAATLDMLGATMADIYAERSGGDAELMRVMMLEETWMSANDAKAHGFATIVGTEEPAPVASFDYASAYLKTPSEILRAGQRKPAPAANTVANATIATSTMETPLMAKSIEAVADTPATEVPAAPVKDVAAILARCTAAKLTLPEANDIIAKAKDVAEAQDLIINKLADRDPAPTASSVVVVADAKDKFFMGVEKALLGKSHLSGGERNEFSSMTLREIARECLMRSGQRPDADPMAMVQRAFSMSGGMHSTSDFTNVLANVANKAMLKGYEEASETFEMWTARGTLTDFKAASRVDTNLFPSLSEVPEGAEYTYGTMGDRGVTIQLATYGKMFAITRQAIINDDLSAFTRTPRKMGQAARRTIGNLVYAVINDNANMADGNALFSAAHSNLAGSGGAPTTTTVDAARAAMAKQKDPDSHASGGLNIRPAYFLVPVELEGKVRALMNSEFDPAGTQRTPNTVRGLAEVVPDARLSTASATAWYLAADPNMYDTIEVAYLNGVSQPTLEQRDGWNVDGVEFKVRIDAGVKALDYRGLYKNGG